MVVQTSSTSARFHDSSPRLTMRLDLITGDWLTKLRHLLDKSEKQRTDSDRHGARLVHCCLLHSCVVIGYIWIQADGHSAHKNAMN